MESQWSSQKTSPEYLLVNSCGTEQALEQDIPTHRPAGRVDYHILYVRQGVCRLGPGPDYREVPAGNLILFRPGEPQHYCFLASQQSVSRYIHFTGAGCGELLARFFPAGQSVWFIGQSASLEMLLERMQQEYVYRRPFYRESCAALLLQLLALAGRKLQYTAGDGSSAPDKRIEAICYRIHQEYRQDVPLDDYARDCCLSLSRFAHLFKKNVGVSPVQYRNALRLDRAKDLLLYSDLPIRQVSELVGFCDHSYFTRLFTARAGCSPARFRRS